LDNQLVWFFTPTKGYRLPISWLARVCAFIPPSISKACAREAQSPHFFCNLLYTSNNARVSHFICSSTRNFMVIPSYLFCYNEVLWYWADNKI